MYAHRHIPGRRKVFAGTARRLSPQNLLSSYYGAGRYEPPVSIRSSRGTSRAFSMG